MRLKKEIGPYNTMEEYIIEVLESENNQALLSDFSHATIDLIDIDVPDCKKEIVYQLRVFFEDDFFALLNANDIKRYKNKLYEIVAPFLNYPNIIFDGIGIFKQSVVLDEFGGVIELDKMS